MFLRHNCIPAPRTIYRGIAKLEPGQVLTVGAAPAAARRLRRRATGRPARPSTRPAGARCRVIPWNWPTSSRRPRRRRVRPHGGRRPRGGVSVGRGGLEPRRRPHAAGTAPAGADLHHRLRREGVRRVGRRRRRGRAPGHRSHRACAWAKPTPWPSSPPWPRSGTSRSATARRSPPCWSAGLARSRRSRCRCRATEATSYSPATTGTPGSSACPGARPPCPPRRPPRAWVTAMARVPPGAVDRAARLSGRCSRAMAGCATRPTSSSSSDGCWPPTGPRRPYLALVSHWDDAGIDRARCPASDLSPTSPWPLAPGRGPPSAG